jgi:acetate kinase
MLSPPRLLTLNTGSSSVKLALYAEGDAPEIVSVVERIGSPVGHTLVQDAQGRTLASSAEAVKDHSAALNVLLLALEAHGTTEGLGAIGHRVVHGGPLYREPTLVTAQVVDALRQLVVIDPDHLPQAILGIETLGRAFPGVPQVACFDTAFHRHMPVEARVFALPRALADEGVVRYGFHGLSYEFVLDALGRIDPAAARGRVVIAHLGNGASMAAVRNGVGIDTTMGFTPTGGLVMGTRSGDLDPGVLLYLLLSKGQDARALSALVNKEAGLLGLSGTSGDMQDLLRAGGDARAAEAISVFCYQAKKFLGGLVAALGGLDTLVFTGGIGEHAPAVRAAICEGLSSFGIALDPERNTAGEGVISPPFDPVTVRVIKTDENAMVARHARRLAFGGPRVPV